MQSNASQLARSVSTGPSEARSPPPIKPKPASLSAQIGPKPVRTTPGPASSTTPPLGSQSAIRGASIGGQNSGTPDAAQSPVLDRLKAFQGHIHSAQQQSNTLRPPTINSRPRSVSSPAPPARPDTPEHNPTASSEGIDNTQQTFGNLRARFQSQASLSSVSLPRQEPTSKPGRLQPTSVPIILGQNVPSASPSQEKPARRATQPSIILPSESIAPRSKPSIPPAIIQLPRPSPPKAPKVLISPNVTPPRIPTPMLELIDPSDEKNPFMASDEEDVGDDASSSVQGLTMQAPKMPPPPTSRQPLPATTTRPIAPIRMANAAPPPKRVAPRPSSPTGPPPMLPRRSASMAELTPEQAEKKHHMDKRRRVVQELLETEISFSKDLLLLQQVYLTDMTESHLFTQLEEKTIFSNLQDVIGLTLDFITLLTEACGGEPYDDESTTVGEAFSQTMTRIGRVYSEYCKRQESSAQLLQELESKPENQQFFADCQEKCKGKTTGWDLASLLIKPVQRVLKYPLLINQIYALTPPEHPDFDTLSKVQKDIHLVAEEINEIKKRKDIVEKIVGSKKKNDSDIMHGFNKKFSRTTQQLRQAVGGSDVTVDILYEALLQKFNMQQRLIRDFAKYIQAWLVSIKHYFEGQEAFATCLVSIYALTPVYYRDENEYIAHANEYYKSLAQFSRTIGKELENQLKRTVYRGIENFLRLYSGPLQVMKKREKKLLDFDRVRGLKERGETIDKNLLESAGAYTAINEQLIDELPKFMGLTTQYFGHIVIEFSKVQGFFYKQLRDKFQVFFASNVDKRAQDLTGYLSNLSIVDDYVNTMTAENGPISRLARITLIQATVETQRITLRNLKGTQQGRKRSASLGAQVSGPHAYPLPAPTPVRKPTIGSLSSSQTSLQLPSKPFQFSFDDDENPFEMESVFQDAGDEGEYTVSLQYRSHSRASSVQSETSDFGGNITKPPAMDDDMDEIGLAQALFECTAIYPYQATEDRELGFVAGESIVVFGLDDNGWWFGKKVGKESKGWFPASHCIQF